MSLISLSLGLFNLFPIPVLEGGLILMLGVEGLMGLAGKERTMSLREKIQTAGLALILLLMGDVIYSDIAITLSERARPEVRLRRMLRTEPSATRCAHRRRVSLRCTSSTSRSRMWDRASSTAFRLSNRSDRSLAFFNSRLPSSNSTSTSCVFPAPMTRTTVPYRTLEARAYMTSSPT